MTSDPRPDDLEATGAHPDDARALSLACAAVDSGLLVVTGPDTGMSLALATVVARTDAAGTYAHRDPANADMDVHIAQPSGASWTVPEVEAQILRPATMRPLNRAHIVVADAHLLSAAAADRLLKAVEEPRNDTLYWFCVPDADSLAITMRSRASRVLPVRPVAGDQLRAALAATGVPAAHVQEIQALAAQNSRLALAVARTGTLPALRDCDAAAHATAAGQDPHPTGTADRWLSALCELAAATRTTGRRKVASATASDARSRWDKLDTSARAEARRLVRPAITRTAVLAADQIPGAATAATLAAIEQRLAACARAHQELATNAPPLTVLSALTSRCAHPCPQR